MFAFECVKPRPVKRFSKEAWNQPSSAYLEREQRVQADKHLLPAAPSKTQMKTHTHRLKLSCTAKELGFLYSFLFQHASGTYLS